MPTDPKKKAQTKAKSQAKRQVKKAAKKNPGIVIALVAIVVIIVVVAVVLYLKVPAIHDAVENIIHPESSTNENGTNNNGTSNLILGEGELKIHFLNVGQGDCIYIQFPDGKDMLIDCGNKSSNYDFDVTTSYLDNLNSDGAITYLMLTHGDEDHVDHLDQIVNRYQISTIYMPNILATPSNSTLKSQVDNLDPAKLAMFTDADTLDTAVYAKFFIAALSEENCQIVLNVDQDDTHNTIVISDESTYELKFYCMTIAGWTQNTLKNAHEKNAVSPIGVLTYNGKRILLTGDSNQENEPEFISRIGTLDCDVLKVGHHGSETSSTDAFLDAITCDYAIISCNMDGNTFYHPRQSTLDRFVARHYAAIYRTDLNGTIVLTINGDGALSFTTEKTATADQEQNGLTSAEIDTIKEYKTKLSNGEITQDEYDQKHREIIGW